MTLLILLASLAAMEYVLRREERTRTDRAAAPESRPTNTTELLSLGTALHQHGRGQAPDDSQQPAAKRLKS